MNYDTLDDLEGKTDSIVENTLHRIRLSYDNINDTAPTLSLGGNPLTDITWTEKVDDGNGNMIDKTQNATVNQTMVSINAAGKDAAYAPLGDNEIRFIPETGELLLGDNVY